MKFITYISFIFLIIPNIVFAQDCSNLEPLHWILGTWQQENEKSLTTESWKKLSLNTFDGSTITRSKADNKITFMETLRIVEMSDEVFYLAKVSHNEYPIAFKLTECSDITAVFENATHDFPTKIAYKLADKNKILNITVGSEDREFNVVYKRISEY